MTKGWPDLPAGDLQMACWPLRPVSWAPSPGKDGVQAGKTGLGLLEKEAVSIHWRRITRLGQVADTLQPVSRETGWALDRGHRSHLPGASCLNGESDRRAFVASLGVLTVGVSTVGQDSRQSACEDRRDSVKGTPL